VSAGPWASVRYRVGQFWRALTAWVAPDEPVTVDALLPAAARRLFACQPAADRAHALAVLRALWTEEAHRDLLAAALLHDVGKADAGLSALHRAAIVLLDRWSPRLLARLSREEGWGASGWRRPFVGHAGHAALGAERARAAGCSPLTVALIARHHERLTAVCSEEDRLLAVLQQADRTC